MRIFQIAKLLDTYERVIKITKKITNLSVTLNCALIIYPLLAKKKKQKKTEIKKLVFKFWLPRSKYCLGNLNLMSFTDQ